MQICNEKELDFESVSHNPEIRKKVFLRNGIIPRLTNLSMSIFKPGQTAIEHSHDDMYEIFLVTAGRGIAIINNIQHELSTGCCLVIEPGEKHVLGNPEWAKEDLCLTYFGIEDSASR